VSVDDIAPRYLGRGFTADEGVPPAAVDEAQRRLGMRIPASLAYYYQRAGRCAALNALHHRLYAPSELLVDGGFLVFMDENQSVVSWGFRTTDCGEDDPNGMAAEQHAASRVVFRGQAVHAVPRQHV
jgi:hypothetical protein